MRAANAMFIEVHDWLSGDRAVVRPEDVAAIRIRPIDKGEFFWLFLSDRQWFVRPDEFAPTRDALMAAIPGAIEVTEGQMVTVVNPDHLLAITLGPTTSKFEVPGMSVSAPTGRVRHELQALRQSRREFLEHDDGWLAVDRITSVSSEGSDARPLAEGKLRVMHGPDRWTDVTPRRPLPPSLAHDPVFMKVLSEVAIRGPHANLTGA